MRNRTRAAMLLIAVHTGTIFAQSTGETVPAFPQTIGSTHTTIISAAFVAETNFFVHIDGRADFNVYVQENCTTEKWYAWSGGDCYIQFPLTTIPAGASIVSSKLRLQPFQRNPVIGGAHPLGKIVAQLLEEQHRDWHYTGYDALTNIPTVAETLLIDYTTWSWEEFATHWEPNVGIIPTQGIAQIQGQLEKSDRVGFRIKVVDVPDTYPGLTRFGSGNTECLFCDRHPLNRVQPILEVTYTYVPYLALWPLRDGTTPVEMVTAGGELVTDLSEEDSRTKLQYVYRLGPSPTEDGWERVQVGTYNQDGEQTGTEEAQVRLSQIIGAPNPPERAPAWRPPDPKRVFLPIIISGSANVQGNAVTTRHPELGTTKITSAPENTVYDGVTELVCKRSAGKGALPGSLTERTNRFTTGVMKSANTQINHNKKGKTIWKR